MSDTDTNTRFEDADSYNYNFDKDRLTFKDIILQHLKKISGLASVEFRGGYWEVRDTPISIGNCGTLIKSRIYIPDTRECYSNAINCFADMLAPYFDKEMKEAEKKAEGDLDKAYKDNTVLVEPTRTDENEEEAEDYKKELEKERRRVFKDGDDRISYRNERVEINRKLFRALCCFLYRKKYLDLGAIED